mmetsp:Transcript_220/g.273  ORF Transcript_220/g.273 Transcript_220/m.273 type:complete len:85 (-) Transcript_220:90-344(-)
MRLANLATTDHGATPLYIAAQQGHVEVVRLLIEAGVDPNIPLTTTVRATPVLTAHEHGHHEVVELLKQAGGNDDKVSSHSCILT